MRSAHRKREIHHKYTERGLKRSNAFLSKKVRDLELENEVLRAEAADQSHNLARCISTREDNKTYSTACRKTIYSCLEYQVPVTSVCNVIKAVLEHLGNVTVDSLPDPRTVSYFAYDLGIISDLQVGEIM